MDELFDRLESIASQMNALPYDESAGLHYDAMADALWWSDERPAFNYAKDHWCLRPVFRYRTSMITGVPEGEWLRFWDRARELFPQWPGFHESRNTRSKELLAFYRQHSKAALDSFREGIDE